MQSSPAGGKASLTGAWAAASGSKPGDHRPADASLVPLGGAAGCHPVYASV